MDDDGVGLLEFARSSVKIHSDVVVQDYALLILAQGSPLSVVFIEEFFRLPSPTVDVGSGLVFRPSVGASITGLNVFGLFVPI